MDFTSNLSRWFNDTTLVFWSNVKTLIYNHKVLSYLFILMTTIRSSWLYTLVDIGSICNFELPCFGMNEVVDSELLPKFEMIVLILDE